MNKKIIYLDFEKHKIISRRTYYRRVEKIKESEALEYIPLFSETKFLLEFNLNLATYFFTFNSYFSTYQKKKVESNYAANDPEFYSKKPQLELLISKQ